MATDKTIPAGLPSWSREAAIGDYGGDLGKVASETEGNAPYAWFVYREIAAMRGSAYSGQIGGTLVHCENLALARVLAWTWFRLPEQFRANCLPGTADAGLEYWAKVLAIPTKASDQRWQVRQRCAAHYRAVTEVNLPAIQAALSDLLGDVYVDATFQSGASLTSPPDWTYWPGVNAGPSSHDLGGGTWASVRSHLTVTLQQPSGMTLGDFKQLVNVQMFQLLDRMLPAYCTFSWNTSDGFIVGLSQIGFDGL